MHHRDRAAGRHRGDADVDAPATTHDVDALLKSLLDQGVPASTVAQALKAMPGVGRNQAYERVLALGRGSAKRT